MLDELSYEVKILIGIVVIIIVIFMCRLYNQSYSLKLEDTTHLKDTYSQIGQDINIIDLRDTAELIENGVIPGSHHASRGHLEFFADPKCEYYKDCFNKEKEIILFCNSGARSALAAYTLKTMGYKNVSHMKGGFKAWMKEIGVIEDFS